MAAVAAAAAARRKRWAWIVCPVCTQDGQDGQDDCFLCAGAGKLKAQLICVAAGSGSRSGMGRIKMTAADKAWAAEVKERDGHRCRRCGLGPDIVRLQAAHIISRRVARLRTNVDNGLTLCVSCHRWADADPAAFNAFAAAEVGLDDWCELVAQVGRQASAGSAGPAS